MTFVLEAHAIEKAYGGVHALRDVHFALAPGEVHGLIGANGAGKSTLCKIIAGIEAPTSGELLLDGAPVKFASVRAAAAKGIDIIHQELSLFPNLRVSENMFVGRELRDRFGMVDQAAQRREAEVVLARLGYPIDPDALVGDLPIGAQQIVEIAKALVHSVRILLMDEPTSALSRTEVTRLFEIIKALAGEGVAIVYISHRLDEMIEICDRITVMRDGEVVGSELCSAINPAWIVERMTGQAATAGQAHVAAAPGDTVLDVANLSLPRRQGRVALENVSFNLRSGEVVGVFGLLGAGRTELFETLLGMHRDASGRQSLAGAALNQHDVAERVALGVTMLPEDRQRDGLIGTMSVRHNMTASITDRLTRFGWLQMGRERAAAQGMVEKLRIKLPALDGPVQALSGGNQQKVVLGRNLLAEPKVLLLDEPTRGVDVAAKAEILAQMHRLAETGVAVMFASSDVHEILTASTRILVMSRGAVALEAAPAAASENLLLEAASRKAAAA